MKVTSQQPDEEMHRARPEGDPRVSASSIESGCAVFLVNGGVAAWMLPEPCLLGYL